MLFLMYLLGHFKAFRWSMSRWAGYKWYFVNDGYEEFWLCGSPGDKGSWYSLHPTAGCILMECEATATSKYWLNKMVKEIES